jgi:hypothetical protein
MQGRMEIETPMGAVYHAGNIRFVVITEETRN